MFTDVQVVFGICCFYKLFIKVGVVSFVLIGPH